MSYIENTWVAYALQQPGERTAIERSLARVRDHLGQAVETTPVS